MREFPDYEFLKEGKVYSKLSNKILKPSINKKGYETYRLRNKEGVFITKSAHRLFAEKYLEDFNEELQVNHIDGEKTNNLISNLEMVTASENMKHAVKKGLIDNRKKDFRNFGYDVVLVCLRTGKETEYTTLGKALKYLGYSSGYTSWNRVKEGSRELKGHKIIIEEDLIKRKK